MDEEQLMQESVLWPWIDDSSCEDIPEDYYWESVADDEDEYEEDC